MKGSSGAKKGRKLKVAFTLSKNHLIFDDNKPNYRSMISENPHKYSADFADDVVLWEQIKNGDKLGMEGLYVKYTHQLFRLGMSIKNDRSFIKDCIHEVFVNIWQYRH